MVSGMVFCHLGPFEFGNRPTSHCANLQMLARRRRPGILSTSPETHPAVHQSEVYCHRRGSVL